MSIAAFVVSALALCVALAAANYARTQAQATKTQANAATRADHRARRPKLEVTLEQPAGDSDVTATYKVKNLGEEDLDSVVISRPQLRGGLNFPVAPLGGGWGDRADLERLEIKSAKTFVLSIGSGQTLPEFRVRVECRIGTETWHDAIVLDDPRLGPTVF